MSADRPPRRPPGLKSFLFLLAASAGVGVIMGVAAGFLQDSPVGEGTLGLVLRAAVLGVGLAIGLFLCLRWWAALDEAAREAHKWAWFWGGSSGMTLGLLALVTLAMAEPEGWPRQLGETPPEAFALGALAILMAQMLGYAVAWALWWLRHR